MSMKDKALQVKQDFDDVYEAGKENIISNSKYIEKQASGKVIRLDDVSEVAHKVVVKADEPTEVKVYGKNLFNNDTSLLKEVNFNGSSKPDSCIGYEIELPKGRYTFTIAKLDASFDGYIYGMLNNKNGEYVGGFHLTEKKNLFSPLLVTLDEGDKLYVYNAVGKDMSATTALFKKVNIQLSAYSQGGDFEEYHCQTITATSEGTETPSNCPAMTFLADSEITVDYFGSYGRAEAELAMWNGITHNGTRQYYTYGFAYADFSGYTIPEGLCKPRSTIAYMFSNYKGVEMPKGIDCSRLVATVASNQCYYTFYYATNLKKIYDMGVPAGMAYGTAFSYCSALEEIEKIRCDENTTFNTNVFNQCTNLIHIGFTGTIASDINLQWSTKLDLESLVSLFNCLKNFLADDPDNAHTKTITLSAESWALLDEYVYENGYNDYVNAQDVVLNVLGWNVA